MGLWGLGKGLAKVAGGIITCDEEMLCNGLKKTAVNAVTTTTQLLAQELWEKAHTDDDDD